MKLLLNS